jgi:hypothetical protein
MAVSFRNRQLKLDTAESTAALVEQLKPVSLQAFVCQSSRSELYTGRACR